MKLLLDPVYTQRPRVCSTSYLMWELIEQLTYARDDVFFYVLYPPERMEEADWTFMKRFEDRVTLLPMSQSTSDRLSELYMMRNSLRFYLNPWCLKCWDVDVVVSSRMPVMKHYGIHSSREGSKAMKHSRMYVGLEEMPVLPFRDTVPWSSVVYPDTLVSYGLLDAVLVNHQWMTKLLRPYLREVLSPAWQKKVLENLHEVVPVKLDRLKMKKEYHGGDFNVTFVGRITGTRNFEGALDVFRKQFSYPLGKNKQAMKFLVSTNTEAVNVDYGETDFIDIQMNDRPKFYSFLDQAHVAVNLSTVEDFSLTTYETLRAGVPTIVGTYPWNDFLGPDYPFRVKNNVEAYGMLNAFAADYATMYHKFKAWEATWWKSYVEGPLNVTTSERLLQLIAKFEEHRKEQFHAAPSFQEMLDGTPQADGKLDLSAYLKKHGKMFSEVQESFSLTLGRYPTTLFLKLAAMQQGWRDTNQCGIMQK